MSRFSVRRLAVYLMQGVLVLGPCACGPKVKEPVPVAAPPVAVAAPEPPESVDTSTPREVELYDAKMKFRDSEVVLLEIKYRFKKGQPQPGYVYQLDLTFPGTDNKGYKQLHGREVQKEASLKDGFQLPQPGAKAFEIRMMEAQSPMHSFHKISEVLKGEIQ